MKEFQILRAAIVQEVFYTSEEAMHRIHARKATYGHHVSILALDHLEDGSVYALIQFPYNDKKLFDPCKLSETLRNG